MPIDMGYPLMQVQPLQQSTYSEEMLESMDKVDGIEEFTQDDWENCRQTITKLGRGFKREKGFYAKMVRRQKSHPRIPWSSIQREIKAVLQTLDKATGLYC
jgi:hypothetical protein